MKDSIRKLLALAMLLVGWSVSQRAVAQNPTDYQVMKTRNIRVDLNFEDDLRSKIASIELLVSRDQGQTWIVAETTKPEQGFIAYVASEDGMIWVTNVTVFKDRTREPQDPSVIDPTQIQKLLIDTTAPVLRLSTLERQGTSVVLNWTIEERYPNDAKTRIEWRLTTASDPSWKVVQTKNVNQRQASFNPETNAAIQVRIIVEDYAGNTASLGRDLPGIAGSAEMNLASAVVPDVKIPVGGLTIPALDMGMAIPDLTLPKMSAGAPVIDLTSVAKAESPITAAAAQLPAPAMPQPLTPTFTAPGFSAPLNAPPSMMATPPTAMMSPPAPTPIASGSGVAPQNFAGVTPSLATPAALPTIQTINYLRFDLPYQLDAGPSGISKIDLYLTRDDGRSWMRWSQHDGKETPLKVSLESKGNREPEGVYGLRLVAISGAGLSETPPVDGTVPDFRIQVDLSPPNIKIYQPEADQNQRNTLVLKWSVTDRNLGKEPIAVEWSEAPTGPWKSVYQNESSDTIVAGVGAEQSQRMENTGTYVWHLPPTLPSHKLYLRMMAWDTAGNKSEVVTPNPIMVDLTKPRARIQGIVPSGPVVQRP